ncbi:amidase family protein [Nocardioides sp. LHG3406-4]|uniref:amidase family protein n=1 Tax=Nocardioides sp. LHG3406-4 TaxID=2804575 RepID=UPI003CE6C75E
MQFTVIGAGAIGGTVGAHLVRAGHDVLFVDADEAHVKAMNAQGLHVSGPVNDFVVPARAVTPDGLPEVLDGVVLVGVKSQHTAEAVAPLAGRLAPDALVVSLQNGLTADIIGPVVGYERLLVCFVNFGADYLAPGEVIQGNVGTFRIGELDGRLTERLALLAETLPYAEATDSILGYLWSKEAYGAMLWAGAVSDLSIADSLEDPRYQPLMLAIAREVLDQAPVTPLPFDGFEPDDLPGSLERLVVFNRGSAKSHSGIYRDLAVRKRPTEVAEGLDPLDGPLTSYVSALIRAIERGERSCEVANLDLLATYERLERLGRPLNAVVTALPAPARAAEGPLHGVAVAVKDIIAVAGSPRGNGNPDDMSGPAETEDAPVVARLREAGADVFALSTLLEYAAGAPHPDLPEARNPVNPDRTAGGSSGGSAALVGAGVCPAALGTDTGGSIRIPAAYCGVVGFKPTYGLVSADGVVPLSPTLDHVGVLAASVADCLEVMAAVADLPRVPATTEGPVRLGVLEQQLADPRLDPEIAQITRAALERLASAGMELTPRNATPLTEIGALLEPILLVEAWEVHRDAMSNRPEHYGEPTRRLFAMAGRTDPQVLPEALARRELLQPAATDVCTGVDALIGPVVPYAAPQLTPPIDTPEGEIEGIFTGPYNVTGQPAISIPCGVTAAGLPVAVQLAAPVGGDAALLRVAAAVEAALRP